MHMIRRVLVGTAAFLSTAVPAVAQTTAAAPAAAPADTGSGLIWVWAWILVAGVFIFIVGTSVGGARRR
jgi:hypothetical protein